MVFLLFQIFFLAPFPTFIFLSFSFANWHKSYNFLRAFAYRVLNYAIFLKRNKNKFGPRTIQACFFLLLYLLLFHSFVRLVFRICVSACFDVLSFVVATLSLKKRKKKLLYIFRLLHIQCLCVREQRLNFRFKNFIILIITQSLYILYICLYICMLNKRDRERTAQFSSIFYVLFLVVKFLQFIIDVRLFLLTILFCLDSSPFLF